MNDYSLTMEDTLETLAAMRHQEDTGYVAKDWLRLGQESESKCIRRPLHWEAAFDIECRDKMVAWCIQVIDFCKFSHETVEITMSYLDRFLSTPEGTTARNDRSTYQLACMAALYTAVKIHEPRAMSLALVSRFSHGAFTARDIEAMEVKLLNALQWRVNPPTSWAFMRNLMTLIPSDLLDKEMREAADHLALLQIELSVATYQFVCIKASTVAYSALMNALESLGLDESILSDVGYILSKSLSMDCTKDHVYNVQSTLYQLVTRERRNNTVFSTRSSPQRGAVHESSSSKAPRTSVEISPRAVLLTTQRS
jgi:hypothetical protein